MSGGEKSNERIEVLRGGAKEEEPLEGGELGKEEALAVLNHERGGPKFLKGRRGEEETEGREVVASREDDPVGLGEGQGGGGGLV